MDRSTYNLVLGCLCGTAMGFNLCMTLVSGFAGWMNWPAFVAAALGIAALALIAWEGE